MLFIRLQVIFVFPPFLSAFFTMSDIIIMVKQTVGNITITKREPSNKVTQKENSATPRVTPVKRKEEPVETEASPTKKPRPPVVEELDLSPMSKMENPGGPSKTESGAEPGVLHSNFENAQVRQSNH